MKPGQLGTQNDQGTITHRPTQTVVTLLTIAVVFIIMLDDTAKIMLAEEDGLSRLKADVPYGWNKACGVWEVERLTCHIWQTDSRSSGGQSGPLYHTSWSRCHAWSAGHIMMIGMLSVRRAE